MIWLHNSKAISLLAVVFFYSSANTIFRHEAGTSSWWISNIYNSMTVWCIPVFVMISGAILLNPLKKESLYDFYLKKTLKFTIPIVFWSLYFPYWQEDSDFTIADLIKYLMTEKPYFHLLLLYTFIPLYLLTPLFRKIIEITNHFKLFVFVILSLLLFGLGFIQDIFFSNRLLSFICQAIFYYPYFFIGYLIRYDSNKYSQKLLWFIFLLSIILTVLWRYALSSDTTDPKIRLYFYNHFSVTVIPMSISLMYLLKSWVKPIINSYTSKQLSHLTLGAYLIHPIFLDIFKLVGLNVIFLNPAWSIPCITILVLLLSLIFAHTISIIPYVRRII